MICKDDLNRPLRLLTSAHSSFDRVLLLLYDQPRVAYSFTYCLPHLEERAPLLEFSSDGKILREEEFHCLLELYSFLACYRFQPDINSSNFVAECKRGK